MEADMATYHIVEEHHVTSRVWFRGKEFPPSEFHYAIRRDDGSLVYRAPTHEKAAELLKRLMFFTS